MRRHGFQVLEHCWNKLGNCGVYVHGALDDRIRRFGIHSIQNAVNNFVTARS